MLPKRRKQTNNVMKVTPWCLNRSLQCELRKGNRDSILNLSKSKRKILKLLSMDDSIFIFLSYGIYIGRLYGCISNHFCKACQNCLRPGFEFVQCIGCMNCCFVVKVPGNAIMQHKQRQLEQNNFDMFYRIYCCVAIHGRI